MTSFLVHLFAILSTITNIKSQNNGFAHGTYYTAGVSVTVQIVGVDTTIEMCGPTGTWFGVGFDALVMESAYALIAIPTLDNSLDVEERILGNSFLSNPAGVLAPSTITVLDVKTEDDDTICATITRKTEDSSASYDFPNTFSNTSETEVIVAIGSTETFTHMASSRVSSTLSYTVGTMDPATQPTESPAQLAPDSPVQAAVSECATYISLFDEEYTLSWEIVDDYIGFEITLIIDTAIYGWVGLGFGGGQYMHGQDIIKINFERVTNGSNDMFFAMDGYSPGWFPAADTDLEGGSDDLFDFSGAFIDNLVVFNFKRPLIASDEWDYPILSGFQYFIAAYQLNCFDCKHDLKHRKPVLVNWYTGNFNTNLNNFDTVRLYHGITMMILFGFAYPSSSFIARYLRHKLWWKQAHQKIGSLGLMTSLTSAYFAISTTAPGKYSKHGLLGIGCVILLCVQFAGGFGVGYWFEHWKRNKWYNKLHYTHLGLAISLNFAAPVTMWYGWLRLQPYHVPALQYAPVWFSYFALLVIIGEIYKRYYPKWSKNSEYSAFESNYHVFTWDEIGEKVSAGAAWIIIDKYVLDVTLFYLSHPGGRKILLDHTGTDCSQYFHGSKPMDGLQKYAHSEWAKKQMARMIVGEIPSQTQNVIGRSFTNRNFSRYGSSTKAEVAINDEDSDEETDNAFDHNKLDAFLESYEIDELVDLIDNITYDEGSDDDDDANRNRIISKETLLKHKANGVTIADLARKTQKVSEAKRFRIVKLLSKTKVSAADCSRPIFLFEFDIDAQTKFCAGDYILLHDTGKETVTRAYTPINPGFILCDNGTPLQNEREAAKNKRKNCAKCFVRKAKPTEGGRLFLLVRLYKKGRMSSVLSSLNINSSLRLTGPFERQQLLSPINFGFGKQCWRRVILICGGTGITPMINALFHHLKYGTDKCRVLLIWYNRTISDVVCIDHLKYFKERYAKRFWIDLVFSAYQKNTNECIERELLQFTTIHAEKWNKKQALLRIRSFLIDGHGISRMRSFITNKLSKQTKTTKRLGGLGIPDTESRDQTEDEDGSRSLQTDIDVNGTKTNVDTQEVSLSSAVDSDEDILENICCEIVGDVEGSEIVQSNENDAKDDIGVDAKKRILSNRRTFDNGKNKDEHDDIKGDVNIDINVGTDMQRRYDDDNGIETVHLSPFDRIIFSGPKRFVEEFLEWLKAADDLSKLGGKQIISLD